VHGRVRMHVGLCARVSVCVDVDVVVANCIPTFSLYVFGKRSYVDCVRMLANIR